MGKLTDPINYFLFYALKVAEQTLLLTLHAGVALDRRLGKLHLSED
jgi:hypothetical protein